MQKHKNRLFEKEVTIKGLTVTKEYKICNKTILTKEKFPGGRRYTLCGIKITKISQNNYRFPPLKYAKQIFERRFYAQKYQSLITKNKNAKILVVLHLYYAEAWPMIAEYLKNLAPYDYHLIITYTKEKSNPKTLRKIKKIYPNAKLFPYENKGFDVDPFLDALKTINLKDYDIIFKLHSKGTKRPFIYIYNQIFKKKDWFFNLFDGILSPKNLHQAIDMLLNGSKTGLVAAANLIVKDPVHKQYFTQNIANRLGVNIKSGYLYVAGTCFAVKSAALAGIKGLNLSINDFKDTSRGEFSLAHAMERIVCAAMQTEGFELKGLITPHNVYAKKIKELQKKSALRLLEDNRVELDYDFFYKILELEQIKNYEIKHVKLKDIKRKWIDGKIYPLASCSPYKYLKGDTKAYEEYCRINAETSPFKSMSSNRFEALKASFANGYNEKKMPVVNARGNILLDGQHRCCLLLDKYGEDHEIQVLSIRF